MEQVIFLHAEEESEETLSQIQKSLAQRLVLVAPAQIDRLHLSLLLRLARRYTIAQARQVCLVSEDRLARVLAARMGFEVASTLDEYRGLAPGRNPSFCKRRRPPARPQPPTPIQPDKEPAAGEPPLEAASKPSGPHALATLPPEKPGANLQAMLVDGYLPNPAALPGLDEEQEQAEREEHERLYYDIDDDEQPSQAQQDVEQREEQIIARILKTSTLGAPGPAPFAPAPEPSEEQAGNAEPPSQEGQGTLRPMRTIDQLLRGRSRGDVFDWFERQAAGTAGSASTASAAPDASEAPANASAATTASPPAITEPPASIPVRLIGRRDHATKPTSPGKRLQLRPPGRRTWRRLGVFGALALSLVMTGLGVALIPYAEVGFNEEIAPYTGQVLLDAHPAGMPLHPGDQSLPQAAAGLARFDSIATAQASATGQRASATDPNHQVAFPTQADVDLIASHLQTQLQQWGANALYAQAEQGDILGPVVTTTETLAFPAVGTSLPEGVSQFRVSVALHLRATLIRHEALLQATQQQLLLKVHQARPGFAPVQGQAPKLSILSVAPAGAGEAQLDLLVQVQAQAMIGPALTPEQVRMAVAGKDISEARAYLEHWPGITKVSIRVLPTWPGRLPFFSARIYISIVSMKSGTARMA